MRAILRSISALPGLTGLEAVTLWALLDWWEEGHCELPECSIMSWFLWNEHGDYIIRH